MIGVVTLTRQYGGIDVLWASLLRQRRRDIVWIVADQLLDERQDIWRAVEKLSPFQVVTNCLPVREGMVNSFASSMNWGLTMARATQCHLVVSVQDYFWIPDDGLARYERMAKEHPSDLYTGLASLTADPGPEAVHDPKGLFSIFETPWTAADKPKKIAWHDVRGERSEKERNYIEWELNYAAIGPVALYSKIDFPHEFEAGVAYDNQAYAWLAHKALGSRVWLDRENHALGLPHKKYFPEIERREMPFSLENQARFAEWRRGV